MWLSFVEPVFGSYVSLRCLNIHTRAHYVSQQSSIHPLFIIARRGFDWFGFASCDEPLDIFVISLTCLTLLEMAVHCSCSVKPARTLSPSVI